MCCRHKIIDSPPIRVPLFIDDPLNPILFKNEEILMQGSQTQIYWRATFQRKMLHGPQFMRKKLLWATI